MGKMKNVIWRTFGSHKADIAPENLIYIQKNARVCSKLLQLGNKLGTYVGDYFKNRIK